MRVRAAVGGAPAILGIGTNVVALPFGTAGTLSIDPIAPTTFLLPLTLGGAPGLAGAGSADLVFSIPPVLNGTLVINQLAAGDPSVPGGIALSNSFLALYGP